VVEETMNQEAFKRGDRIIFGRPNGQPTLGRVLWARGDTVAIVQLEDRAVLKAGEYWKVHPSQCRLATEEEKQREMDTLISKGRTPIVSLDDIYAFHKVR
jgi:hypothetical protein